MCTNPIRISNNRVDLCSAHRRYLYVPCGHCEECQQQHIDDYASRILYMTYKYGEDHTAFLTFTYNNEHLPRTMGLWRDEQINRPCFDQRHINTMLKALRDKYNKDGHQHIAYYIASEYGGNRKRPHYHMMLHIDDTLNFDEVVEFCRAIWTGEAYKQGRHITKPWKYGNLGFMFPSKSACKQGKAHLRYGKESALYAAKYAAKDTAYMQDVWTIKNKRYKQIYGYEYPQSHVSRYYGLGIKDLPNIDVINGSYIDPLTAKSRQIPRYVMEYIKYTRILDKEATDHLQACIGKREKPLEYARQTWKEMCYNIFTSPSLYSGEIYLQDEKRKVYRRVWNEAFDQDAYLDALVKHDTEAFAFVLNEPEKTAIYKNVYEGCTTEVGKVLKSFGFRGLCDMYTYEAYHLFYKWTHTRLGHVEDTEYYSTSFGCYLTPPANTMEEYNNVINDIRNGRSQQRVERYRNLKQAQQIKQMLNPEDLGEENLQA